MDEKGFNIMLLLQLRMAPYEQPKFTLMAIFHCMYRLTQFDLTLLAFGISSWFSNMSST